MKALQPRCALEANRDFKPHLQPQARLDILRTQRNEPVSTLLIFPWGLHKFINIASWGPAETIEGDPESKYICKFFMFGTFLIMVLAVKVLQKMQQMCFRCQQCLLINWMWGATQIYTYTHMHTCTHSNVYFTLHCSIIMLRVHMNKYRVRKNVIGTIRRLLKNAIKKSEKEWAILFLLWG